MKNQNELENDLPIKLANPAKRALGQAGITRLEQLTTMREADILNLHGIGPNAIKQLRAALSDRGQCFAK